MFREYKPLKVPEGKEEGLLFRMAKGEGLEIFGEMVGLKRRKFEPSFLYKIRIRNKALTDLK